MVKAYLENYQNELMQKKFILERECHELRTKLKDCLLYTSPSPRDCS